MDGVEIPISHAKKAVLYEYNEEQAQQLYDSIAEAVKTEYLEPNNIAPADFTWPVYEVINDYGDIRDEDYAWDYLDIIWENYQVYGTMYDTTYYKYEMPSDATCQLMNSVLDGIVNWCEMPENAKASIISVSVRWLVPFYETIPANVIFK